MVVALQQHVDQERDGETALELVAVKYDGDSSSLAVGNALNAQGQWPGTTLLNQGVWYLALVPDEGVGYLEARDDLTVRYDAESIAAAMLEKNYLPPNVFARGADRDLQDRVFDALGLVPAAEGGPIEDQLREVAGLDEDDVEADDGQDRVSGYVDGYSRSELGEAAKSLRADAEEFNLRENQSKHARAEFIASFDEDEAASALQAASGSEEADD